MTTQFDRTYLLEIGEADPLGLTGAIAIASRTEGALKIEFELEKTELPWPNSATIKVYNLTSAHREYLASEAALPCRLEAGYGASRGELFGGWVRRGVSVHDGTDWVTTLEAAEGEVDKKGDLLSAKSIRKSWKSGTPIAVVIRDFAKELNVDIGNLPAMAGAAAMRTGPVLLWGLAVDGPILDEWTALMRSVGLRWSIQGGAIQLRFPELPAGVLTEIISPFTGLVGHVTKATKKIRRQNTLTKKEEVQTIGTVEGTTLLLPSLTPGQQFILQSEQATGAYLCSAVKHVGDSRGTPWYTEFEGLA